MKDFRRIYREEGAYHLAARGFTAWFLEENYRAIAAQCRQGDRVLDLACGEGCLARHLPGGQLVGLDYSEVALKLNRELLPGRYDRLILGDLRHLEATELGQSGFDRVVCSLSLMYLVAEDLSRCLEQVRQLLAPGGAFVFTYPNVSTHRAPNPTACELRPAELLERLTASGFRSVTFQAFCPLVPEEVLRRSKVSDEEEQARAEFDEARQRMTLEDCYHWLCRGQVP